MTKPRLKPGIGRARSLVAGGLIPFSFAPAPLPANEEVEKRPNIVHIMVDDLGWQDIASHKLDGKPVYETPHLDRMTRNGRRFTQAYSPAPSCAPSRVAFLCGQHPAKNGVYHVSGGRIPRAWHPSSRRVSPFYIYGLPAEVPTIAEVLGQAGYTSGHVGKWHAGGKSAGYPFPLDQGFDFGFTERNGRHKYYNDPDLWNSTNRFKTTFFGSWAKMKPDRLSDFATLDPEDPYQLDEEGRPFDKPLDLALGFIRKHKDKPFFLNYCPYHVHGPIQTRSRKLLEHYAKKMGHEFPSDPGPIYDKLAGHIDPYYASMVDEVDRMIGKVIALLEETDDPRNPGHKLIDNTWVIVDSDNGGVLPYTDNAPLKGGKQNTWEGGVRIPFLVLGPGIKAGSISDTPINLIDLFPTFMEMAGMRKDPSLKLDGANLLPVFKGESDKAILADGTERESLFWFFPMDAHMSAAIRKGEWKLVRNYGAVNGAGVGESAQLFRIYDDSGKRLDLSEAKEVSEQFPEVHKALLSELDDMIEKTGASLPYRNRTATGLAKEEVDAIPGVLEHGSREDQVWITIESGPDKASITEARLVYTLNPKPFDSTRGHREEWFSTPARVEDGRVTATMPPGATHAVFSLRDSNGFLTNSEDLPPVTEVGHNVPDSTLVKNGFAYKPGLIALIKLGEQARQAAGEAPGLVEAIRSAKAVVSEEKSTEEACCDAIRDLRAAIRNEAGAPQAKHPLLNRFPTEPLF